MAKRKTEFVLIERGEDYHQTAVTWEVFDDMLARGAVITSHRPVTKAEIKKARFYVYHADAYFEHMAYIDFEQKYKGKVFKATVLWFDRSSGAGMAQGLNGEGMWPLYACNIPGKKTWYPETACMFHDEKQVIDAEIMCFVGGSILVSHTAGTLDDEKWELISSKNLAFRCDDEGKAITGLFA